MLPRLQSANGSLIGSKAVRLEGPSQKTGQSHEVDSARNEIHSGPTWNYGPSWGRFSVIHVPQLPVLWTNMPLPQVPGMFPFPGASG